MRCPRCGALQADGNRTCTECGRPLILPIAVRQFALRDAAGESPLLPSGITRIGSEPASNEIVVEDETVSARHAAIEVSPQAVIIRDLGSMHGTRVNGIFIRQAAVIQPGDVITFGDREFELTRPPAERPAVPRGIPVPAGISSRQDDAIEATNQLPVALATIALTLLATMLHVVGIADGVERDALPLPLIIMLLSLVVLPLAGIMLVAGGKRSGYLVTAIAALAGLAFVAVSGPIFTGSAERADITDQYGSSGYWFVAIAAVVALIIEILVLTVSLAGWRMLQPQGAIRQSGAPTA